MAKLVALSKDLTADQSLELVFDGRTEHLTFYKVTSSIASLHSLPENNLCIRWIKVLLQLQCLLPLPQTDIFSLLSYDPVVWQKSRPGSKVCLERCGTHICFICVPVYMYLEIN